MKKLKKIYSLILTFALAMGLCVPAMAAEDTGFSDVTANAWYAEDSVWCRDNGIMSGTSGSTFSPNSTMTRAMLAAVLYRAAGSPAVAGNADFSDVAADAYYNSAANWASANRIISGYGNRRFGSNDPVTREQIAAILWRYDGSPAAERGTDFADESSISSYAGQAVDWARAEGIISGMDGNRFVPQGEATRAQVAVILHRYLTGNAPVIPPADSTQPDHDTPNSSTDFDLENGTVMLNNGIKMPILGIGTYTLSNEQAENSVYWALRDGYRLIDTARIYGNEEGVGRGIQKAIDEGLVTREEIFVTTKMWTSDFGNGAAAIDASLRRLNLDYIDLMILHHSQPSNDVTAYQTMKQAVSEGKLRSIGLSNYYTAEDFDRLVNATTITPALLQNETHPHYQSTAMKEHLKQYGTVLESWFPLGGRGHTQELFNDPTISSIAAAHGKTSAQVLLRWHLQAGNVAIPGSSNEAHIAENFDIFDFELTDAEMQRIAAMDQNRRHASY